VNSNLVSDTILDYLETKHQRVYRNKAPKNSSSFILQFPYVVYRLESVTSSYPSEDYYLNVDIYEDVNNSVRDIEDLADNIDNGLNHNVINTDDINLQFEREQRQYINAEELVSAHMINIRYVVQVYFK
jgi:hypothetical protein